MRRRIDWNSIKTEYVTTDISLRALASKHKVSMRDLADHSRLDGWVEQRQNYRTSVTRKAEQKIANRQSNELAGVLTSAFKIKDTISNAVDDPKQFNRYLVTTGSKGGAFETTEEIFEKVDTKAIKEMTSALKAVESLIRSLGGIPTEAEAQRLQIERERFELEKEKWEKEKADANTAHEVHVVFDVDDPNDWME